MIKQLSSEETELSGRWIVQNNYIYADEVTQRIEALIQDSLKKNCGY